MKYRFISRIVCILLLTVLIGGCSTKQEDNNNNNQPEPDDTSIEIGNGDEEGSGEVVEDPYQFERTIENPSALFEKVPLVNVYKPFMFHNPLKTHRFGADPFALVYDGRVYVYMTNDIIETNAAGEIINNSYGKINSLNLISSDDLVNWTDHGPIRIGGFHGAASWAKNSWAPAAAYKNIDGQDKFFLYFANGANNIGVLTSDSPIGPFVDPLRKPLISRSTIGSDGIPWLFDPGVFVDDDGKAYIYYGGGVPEGKEEMPNSARAVQLGDDMISIVGTPVVVEAPFFFEAAYMNKIGDTYYYSYCSNWANRSIAVGEHVPAVASIAYMTSKSPLGPWEYQKTILANPGRFFGTHGNNHHSIIQFHDQWYIFYHSQIIQDAMGISGGYRSTHVDKITITEDGVIQDIIATREGVKQLFNLNPYQVNEAEAMAWSGGISTLRTEEPSKIYSASNMVVGEMTTGSYIGVSGVDFGTKGPKTFTAKVSSEHAGNVIKIVAGEPLTEAIGYLEVPNTGSVETFVEVTINVENVTGVDNLFFVFAGEGFQFDAWWFNE